MLDDDKDDQDILDEHVSRVWSDRTPHRSPGNLSPCNALNQFARRKMHEATFSCGSSKFIIFILNLHFILIPLLFFVLLKNRRTVFNESIEINAGFKHAEIYKMG